MRKRRPKAFSATKAVKAAARQQIGSPKPARPIAGKKKAPDGEKHRTTLARLLGADEQEKL